MSLSADYYDGQSTRRHAVVLDHENGCLRVRGEGIVRVVALTDLRVSEPMGRAPRLVTFPDGAYCEVRDHAGFQALLEATGFQDHFVVRWQFNGRWILLSAVLCVAFLLAGYRWGLPVLSAQIAAGLPESVLASVSDQALASLDERVLQPSRLPASRQAEISARFSGLRSPVERPLAHHVVFRAAKGFPANAIALPSGTLVMTDDLVTLARNDSELMAVLAHELGHVEARHGMRQLIQSTVVGVLMAWFVGDVSSVVAAAPAALLEAGYSREFEREADAFAARMLTENGISPRCLADLLQRLDGAANSERVANRRGAGGGYLSTHPATVARLEVLGGGACQ